MINLSKTLCIYHGNCADGFGSAWAVNKWLEDVEFYPGVYQSPPPDVTGKDVLLVDFSYKRPVILEMAKVANSITIIDHHKTAIEDLVDLPANVETMFDLNHSGAILTWLYYSRSVNPPPLPLLYIEDRDLWRFGLPNSREVNAAIFSYPYDFTVWDKLMVTSIDDLANEGKAIERKHFKDIHELLKVTVRKMNVCGTIVDVANLPYTYSSDAAHILAERPENAFGACYWDTPNGRVFSLRSIDSKIDVSTIAKLYGGGGHRNAAGFRVSHKEANTFLL